MIPGTQPAERRSKSHLVIQLMSRSSGMFCLESRPGTRLSCLRYSYLSRLSWENCVQALWIIYICAVWHICIPSCTVPYTIPASNVDQGLWCLRYQFVCKIWWQEILDIIQYINISGQSMPPSIAWQFMILWGGRLFLRKDNMYI